MNRITLTLAAAAGGLLASAFLSTATALAAPTPDPFGFTPTGGEEVAAVDGIPPFWQDTMGYQEFSTAATTGTGALPAGSFAADVNNWTSPLGWSSEEVTVVASSGAATTAPPVGSTFDVMNFGSGWENVYESVVGTGTGGANTVQDGIFFNGTEVLNLTPYIAGFDASVPTVTDTLNSTFPFITDTGAFLDFATPFTFP